MNEKRKESLLRPLDSYQLLDLLRDDYQLYGEPIDVGYSLFKNENNRKRRCILEVLLERAE